MVVGKASNKEMMVGLPWNTSIWTKYDDQANWFSLQPQKTQASIQKETEETSWRIKISLVDRYKLLIIHELSLEKHQHWEL